MSITPAEYFTYQFYTWEYRGRGWFLADEPVQLEAPYIPFVRHMPQLGQIDDGKRHNVVSRFIATIKGKAKSSTDDLFFLDYEKLEPYVFFDQDALVGLQVKLPKERTVVPESMKALLIMLSTSECPISFEIIGNAREAVIQFVCRSTDAPTIETHIKAYFPELIVVRNETYIAGIFPSNTSTNVIDFGLRDEFVRPLAIAKNFKVDPLTGLYGILENLCGKQQGGIQILFSGTVNSWSASILRSVTLQDGSSFFADAPEGPKLALEKTQSPLFGVTIRAFGQGETNDEAAEVLKSISYALMKASASPYNALIPLLHLEYDTETRNDDIYSRESHRLGMLLNADELVNLLHFPSEQIQSRKLVGTARKTKQLPTIAKGKDLVLGTNIHNGITENVTVGATERLKHTHIIGATGTGKSTLLLSMVVQDIEHGNGVAVLDPHGDLIETILSYIPEKRLQDVVIIDPSDSEYPVGFNILYAHSEIEKEILSSDLVAVFKRNSTSWGDQMNSVFGNALIAFLESSRSGTLADVRRFLIEKEYRLEFLQTVSDPSIRYYWQKEYPLLKTSSIGPILTRLDTFLRPKLIRNMVCQDKGLNFEDILDSQKILLVKLSQGLIGVENSYLLGSFFVSKIHQTALARQARQIRDDFFFYIDEFQHFITPSMAGILSGARKYHVGLTLAHQDMQQLQKYDSEVTSSVIGNVGTRIYFRVGETDAKKLAEGFSFFEARDLQNLDTGEAICRIGRPEFDFSLTTIPLGKSDQPEDLREKILAYSRERYGTKREIVEEMVSKSLQMPFEMRETTSVFPQKKSRETPKQEKPERKENLPEIASMPVQEVTPKQNHDTEITETVIKRKEETQHRYLQTLIKKMAESRGYRATLEAATPDGNGKVDVLLEKDNMQIACEVSVTTDATWEVHNIQKCLAAGYGLVVSCMTDKKAISQLQKKIQESFTTEQMQHIKVFEPEALFTHLDVMTVSDMPTETTFKGYRVKVSYDTLTEEEMKRKRESVAKIVVDSMKRMKK